MKTGSKLFSRKVVSSLIASITVLTLLGAQTAPVFAAGIRPQTEPPPTETPAPTEDAPTFDPNSVSVTLIFDTIIKWLFGKNLIDIFKDIDLTPDQRRQVEALIGETNLVDQATDFCAQVRTGEFARMAESVRASNQGDDGSGSLNPSILMDFFEQLGAFCPGAAPVSDLTSE